MLLRYSAKADPKKNRKAYASYEVEQTDDLQKLLKKADVLETGSSDVTWRLKNGIVICCEVYYDSSGCPTCGGAYIQSWTVKIPRYMTQKRITMSEVCRLCLATED